ncbi:hypothetical protein [Chondrinema litorale]|uniref:hypothetical protein n=1 Tax=Chondrinema litorale TaxID=2994555 RepID=UPI002543B824|nr:hypothetical protein [Chondrinema litorale]UZS00045.1 hypothetical protein OQ292_39585 [Chondrinema litorale]
MSYIHPIYLHRIAIAKKYKKRRLDLTLYSDYYESKLTDFPLSKIPEEIKILNFLEELILKNNKIQELPEWLTGLSKLKLIDIRGNPLQNNQHHLPIFIDKNQYKTLALPKEEIVGIEIKNEEDLYPSHKPAYYIRG